MGRPRKYPLERPIISKAPEPTTVDIQLHLPTELYAELNELADNFDVEVRDLAVDILMRCKDYNGERTIFLDDEQRRELESLLKRSPLATAEDVLSVLRNVLSVVPAGVEGFQPVALTPSQIKKLRLREGFGGLSAQQHLARIIQGAVAKAVGP